MSIRKAFRASAGRDPNDGERVVVRSAERVQRRIHEMRRIVKRDGLSVESAANGTRLHPAAVHEARLEGQLLVLCKALGLTPAMTKSGVFKERPGDVETSGMDEFAKSMELLR